MGAWGAASRLKQALPWLAVPYAVNDCLLSAERVTSGDMSPVLQPAGGGGAAGDVVLVDRLSLRLYRFQRGEVVLVR